MNVFNEVPHQGRCSGFQTSMWRASLRCFSTGFIHIFKYGLCRSMGETTVASHLLSLNWVCLQTLQAFKKKQLERNIMNTKSCKGYYKDKEHNLRGDDRETKRCKTSSLQSKTTAVTYFRFWFFFLWGNNLFFCIFLYVATHACCCLKHTCYFKASVHFEVYYPIRWGLGHGLENII